MVFDRAPPTEPPRPTETDDGGIITPSLACRLPPIGFPLPTRLISLLKMPAVPVIVPFPDVVSFVFAEEEDVVVAPEVDSALEDDDTLEAGFIDAMVPSLETVPYELLLLLLCEALLSLSMSSLNSGFLGAGAFIVAAVVVVVSVVVAVIVVVVVAIVVAIVVVVVGANVGLWYSSVRDIAVSVSYSLKEAAVVSAGDELTRKGKNQRKLRHQSTSPSH